jgi:uncharacterized protein YoaH (UPF0181 family)
MKQIKPGWRQSLKITHQEYLAATDEELQAAGLPGKEEATRLISALAKDRIPRKLKHRSITTLMELGVLSLIAILLRQNAERQQFNNESDSGRAADKIRGYRYQLGPAVAETLSCIKNLPPQKKTGPEPKLTDAQKQSACRTIDTLKHNGSTTKYAIALVSRDYKVTPRLMRRVWESRGG